MMRLEKWHDGRKSAAEHGARILSEQMIYVAQENSNMPLLWDCTGSRLEVPSSRGKLRSTCILLIGAMARQELI